MSFIQVSQAIISLLTLGAFVFAIYKYFRDPDLKNSNSIELMKQGCIDKHRNIDENLCRLTKAYEFMQTNDLKHIENEVRRISEQQVKIFTILEERLPQKKAI